MKTTLILFFFYSAIFAGFGKHAYQNYITQGSYQVGFCDTVIYDQTYTYNAYGYNDKKPCFIQIWHPLKEKVKNPSFLTLKHFIETKKYDELTSVQQQLEKNYKEIIIRDFITENLVTGDSNVFLNYSYHDVLNLVEQTETRSIRYPVSTASFPIIVYHHGSQSNSFENFAMAEYFASRGYIFLASNFHLPYENTTFGLKPFNQIVQGEDEASLKFILAFAKSLTRSNSVYFMGHSWGAQMGFRALDGDTSVKGFISLETTLEFKEDDNQIKEFWPEVFQKVITDSAYYPFPVLLCAATGKKKPFGFFTRLRTKQKTYVTTIKEFEHNAYTSLFYLRYFISVQQTDASLIKKRMPIFVKHLDAIHSFIQSTLHNKPAKTKSIKYIKG